VNVLLAKTAPSHHDTGEREPADQQRAEKDHHADNLTAIDDPHDTSRTLVVPMGNYVSAKGGELRERNPVTPGEIRDR